MIIIAIPAYIQEWPIGWTHRAQAEGIADVDLRQQSTFTKLHDRGDGRVYTLVVQAEIVFWDAIIYAAAMWG